LGFPKGPERIAVVKGEGQYELRGLVTTLATNTSVEREILRVAAIEKEPPLCKMDHYGPIVSGAKCVSRIKQSKARTLQDSHTFVKYIF